MEAARSVAFDPCGERLYCGFKNCVRIFDVGVPGRSCSNRNLKSGYCNCTFLFSFDIILDMTFYILFIL